MGAEIQTSSRNYNEQFHVAGWREPRARRAHARNHTRARRDRQTGLQTKDRHTGSPHGSAARHSLFDNCVRTRRTHARTCALLAPGCWLPRSRGCVRLRSSQTGLQTQESRSPNRIADTGSPHGIATLERRTAFVDRQSRSRAPRRLRSNGGRSHSRA